MLNYLMYICSNILWSGGAVNHYVSVVLMQALKMGLCQQHVEVLKKDYGVSLDIICSSLL